MDGHTKGISNKEVDNAPAGTAAPGYFGDEGGLHGFMQNGTGINPIPEEESKKDGNRGLNAYSPTPTDIAKEIYYTSQAGTEKSKQIFWKRLKLVVSIFGAVLTLVIAVLSIYWAYNLSSIAEPIGGIKEAIDNLKKRDDEMSGKIQKNEDILINKLLETKPATK